MSKKNQTIQLNHGLHALAIDQARSLANQANDAQKKIGESAQLHDVLNVSCASRTFYGTIPKSIYVSWAGWISYKRS